MKKLVTRGLVGVGALAIPLGASLVVLPATAFAGTTTGQGAQTAPLYAPQSNNDTFCGAPGEAGGNLVAHSWVSTNLTGTGDVNTTVHLQGTTPNTSYWVVLIENAGPTSACGIQHNLDGSNPVLTTDAYGDGTMSFTSHNPVGTPISAQVQIWSADWTTVLFGSRTVPLS